MKARPILFSKDMANAIVNGTKTQTRRVIKDSFNGCWTGPNGSIRPEGYPCPNDPVVMYPGEVLTDYDGLKHTYEAEVVEAWFHCSTMDKLAKCPYGKVGDILYGRETIWTNVWDGGIIYTKPEPKYAEFWKATPSMHYRIISELTWSNSLCLFTNTRLHNEIRNLPQRRPRRDHLRGAGKNRTS